MPHNSGEQVYNRRTDRLARYLCDDPCDPAFIIVEVDYSYPLHWALADCTFGQEPKDLAYIAAIDFRECALDLECPPDAPCVSDCSWCEAALVYALVEAAISDASR